MKLLVTFKDPDMLAEAIDNQKHDIFLQLLKAPFNLSRAGAEAEADERMKVFEPLINQYFPYREYLTVELDSETNTIRVVADYE